MGKHTRLERPRTGLLGPHSRFQTDTDKTCTRTFDTTLIEACFVGLKGQGGSHLQQMRVGAPARLLVDVVNAGADGFRKENSDCLPACGEDRRSLVYVNITKAVGPPVPDLSAVPW